MARRPPNFQWFGLTEDQRDDLDFLDLLGDDGWSRADRTDEVMPHLMVDVDRAIGLERVKQCMADIGYPPQAIQMLDLWYSKGTTGMFGSASNLRSCR